MRGGTSIADIDRLNDDNYIKELIGVEKVPGQSSIDEWLRENGKEGD